MSELDLTMIRRRLRGADNTVHGAPRAAVAAVLRQVEGSPPEMLFIRRAEHVGDPWSGHMAFPGGRRDPGDPSLEHTAVRETHEELGLDLRSDAELIAPLDDVPTHLNKLVVRPFVWTLSTPTLVLSPNHEVAEVVWAPIEPMMNGSVDTTYALKHKGVPFSFPAYDVGGRTVWGLTYKMLQIFFSRVRTV